MTPFATLSFLISSAISLESSGTGKKQTSFWIRFDVIPQHLPFFSAVCQLMNASKNGENIYKYLVQYLQHPIWRNGVKFMNVEQKANIFLGWFYFTAKGRRKIGGIMCIHKWMKIDNAKKRMFKLEWKYRIGAQSVVECLINRRREGGIRSNPSS